MVIVFHCYYKDKIDINKAVSLIESSLFQFHEITSEGQGQPHICLCRVSQKDMSPTWVEGQTEAVKWVILFYLLGSLHGFYLLIGDNVINDSNSRSGCWEGDHKASASRHLSHLMPLSLVMIPRRSLILALPNPFSSLSLYPLHGLGKKQILLLGLTGGPNSSCLL